MNIQRLLATARDLMFSRNAARAAAAFALLVAGAASGVFLEQRGASEYVSDRLNWRIEALSRALGWRAHVDNERQVTEREITTALLDLNVESIPLGAFVGVGGAIEEFGNGLIFAESSGYIGYLSFAGDVRHLGQALPLNRAGLIEWRDRTQQHARVDYLRPLDVLLLSDADGAQWLYASYERFADNCVEFVVARIGVIDHEGRPQLAAEGWSDVFVAEPCVALPPEARQFEGIEGAGRMALLNDRTLLVSIGHFGFEGVYMPPAVSMDPSNDLGKIIAIDLPTRGSRIFTMGHRNPQGLALDGQRRIWSTEHGPYGGDELNLIIEGRNYGWPQTTFGMNYGTPRAPWPNNRRQGWHDTAYELPRFTMPPNTGISQLAPVSGDEFPLWEGDLLISSLMAQTLFRVRLVDNTVIGIEPIALGERMRDIIRLRDGRFAILTDLGNVLVISSEARDRDTPNSDRIAETVTGLTALASARADDPYSDAALTRHERGRRLYELHCASCHSVNGHPGRAPNLRSIVGERVADAPRFNYSDALSAQTGVWTENRLINYIGDPQATVPGTAMPQTGIHFLQIPELLLYLEDPD